MEAKSRSSSRRSVVVVGDAPLQRLPGQDALERGSLGSSLTCCRVSISSAPLLLGPGSEKDRGGTQCIWHTWQFLRIASSAVECTESAMPQIR